MQAAPGRLVYSFEIDEATPSNNTLKNAHFRVYQGLRRRWRGMVESALEEAGQGSDVRPAPLGACHLEIDRHSVGSLDWDNAYGGLKPLLDCLVQASARNPDGLGLIRDDSPAHMPRAPVVRQLPAKRGSGRTTIRIYDLDSTP